jgi:hypothetical protein
MGTSSAPDIPLLRSSQPLPTSHGILSLMRMPLTPPRRGICSSARGALFLFWELSVIHKYFDSTSPLSPEFTFSLLTSLIHGVEKMTTSPEYSSFTPVRRLHADTVPGSASFSSVKDVFQPHYEGLAP